MNTSPTSPTSTTADLTPAAAAAMLGVSVGTLASWREAGSGPPATHVGLHVRYRASDLTAWSRAMFGTQQPARSSAVLAAAQALYAGDWAALDEQARDALTSQATRALAAAAGAGWDPVVDLPRYASKAS